MNIFVSQHVGRSVRCAAKAHGSRFKKEAASAGIDLVSMCFMCEIKVEHSQAAIFLRVMGYSNHSMGSQPHKRSIQRWYQRVLGSVS